MGQLENLLSTPSKLQQQSKKLHQQSNWRTSCRSLWQSSSSACALHGRPNSPAMIASCTARRQWITTMKIWTFTTSPRIVYGNRTASPCGAYCITELFELHHFLSRGCIASKPPMHRQLPAGGLCRFRTWRELQHNARSLVARREEGLGEAAMAKWSRELHISRRSAASWEAANCSAHSMTPKEKHLPDVLCGRLRGRGGWGRWI